MFRLSCFPIKLRALLLIVLLSVSLPLCAQFDISENLLNQIQQKYNRFARERVENWQKLINSSQDLPVNEKLKVVNDFFNANALFIDDKALWGKDDYWATPLEMLSVGAGDCEDFAIAKYFTLKKLGVDESKLRITYVKAVNLNQAHMVLTYYPSKRAIPLVLDNLIADIKPANERPDLIPVYSFNGTGLWLNKTRSEGEREVGSSSRISLWQDLEKRMQEQLDQ